MQNLSDIAFLLSVFGGTDLAKEIPFDILHKICEIATVRDDQKTPIKSLKCVPTTREIVEAHLDTWNWDWFSRNPIAMQNLSDIAFLLSVFGGTDLAKEIPFDILHKICEIATVRDDQKTPIITWEIDEAHLDKPWDWDWLSRNPSATWEFIETHPDKPNWDLSRNPSAAWEIIEARPDKPRSWDLSFNERI